MDYKDRTKLQLAEDKISLQNTISSLSDEIEALSVKNEEFLAILNTKEFYKEYQKMQEEFKDMKEAHALLINMIKDEELHVQTNKRDKKKQDFEESNDLIKDTSVILGSDISKVINKGSISEKRGGPLSEIDMNEGGNNRLSSIFSWNAFGNFLSKDKLREQEVDLKHDRSIKNNAEFLSHRLQDVEINFLRSHKKNAENKN